MKNNHESEKNISYKKKLREEIQSKRDSIPITDREKKSRLIANKFFDTAYYAGSNNILVYYPFRSEIDVRFIIRQALKDSKNIIFPKIYKKELKLFYVSNPSKQLEKGSYGIMEPIPRLCKSAGPSDIDLAIVPGVGFDKNLNRIGYGGGFYDKLLLLIPEEIKKIALCFNIQIVDRVPISEHDIKIDLLITESKIYNL